MLTALAAVGCRDAVGPDQRPLGVLSLSVGQGQPLTAGQASKIELSGGSTGADFVLVPFYASATGSANVALEFSGTGITGITTTATAQLEPASGTGRPLGAARVAGEAPRGFHAELRRFEREELPRRAAAARAARSAGGSAALRPSMSASAAAVPAVGDQLRLNATRTPSCENPVLRNGRVVAVTEHAIVVADLANPSGGFTDAEYAAIGQAFDNLVYPLVTETFGTPVDIDANEGRAIIFYTRAVNELTPPNSDVIVGGFFHPRDLFQRTGAGACPASNVAEMFYMLVPDPNGEVNNNVRTKASVQEGTIGILAHEFQHLINASRRLYVNDALEAEEVWLNEGLSHIAEELLFYHVAGLGPRQNITRERIAESQTIVDAFIAYQFDNFARLAEFLEEPETRSPFADDDELATRGAAWQLLRYAADRSTLNQRDVWFGLANSRVSGVRNLSEVLGTDFFPLARDWGVAQYTDDAVSGVPAAYQHPSWNFRSVYPALTAFRRWPLRTRALTAGTPLRLALRAGGAAYLRFSVAAGATGTITPTSSGRALPPAVSMTVVRTH